MKVKKLIIAITGTILVVAILYAVRYPARSMELLLPDQTNYARGYTEDKWSQIKIDLSADEVINILGHPLRITENGKDGKYKITYYDGDRKYKECYSHIHPPQEYDPEKITHTWMSYSLPGKWLESYKVRSVKINQERKVAEIKNTYYQD
jgi:hypothetical protein